MVRTVKTRPVRSLAKGQRAVLLPGPTGAEPWEVWLFGAKPPAEVVQVCSSPLDNKLRKGSTLALPVAQVYCLPLWLSETDPKLFRGVIGLQIEMRGLQPRGAAAIYDWTVVAQEEARTLVSVGILPATLAPEMNAEAYESFELSARYYTFAENALTLWREQDRLVVAITRGAKLVYYQALGEGPITTRSLQDLNCVCATLAMQEILAPLTKVVVWAKVTPDELAALKGTLKLPMVQEDAPAPVTPAPAWDLTPAAVNEAQRTRESQRWIKRAAYIFLVFYLLGVGWLVTHYIQSSLQAKELTRWQSSHADQVQFVLDSQKAWKALGPVVDTGRYPLELLLHASQSIPADQLHLTLFEASYDHILIKGEAKNVAGAFSFLSKLKADPYFAKYKLDMGNPRPLPNDLASFQIEGNYAPTN